MTAKPSEEQQKEITEILAKRKRRARRTEVEEEDSTSILHIKDAFDYMGRSFLHIPQDVDRNLRSETPPEKCFIPKKCVHEFSGHTKGVQKIQLFPISGHLFLTCSLDHTVKVLFISIEEFSQIHNFVSIHCIS
jgi:pre-mRNA-processing factor 17